jgi:hypothetical protein
MNALFLEKRPHSIIERLGGHRRVLSIIEFDESDARVSVDNDFLAMLDSAGARFGSNVKTHFNWREEY